MAIELPIIGSFFLIVTALAWPLGKYIAFVFDFNNNNNSKTIDTWMRKVIGNENAQAMSSLQYIYAVCLLHLCGLVFLFLLLLLQHYLPLNPQHVPNMSWDLALNTAISFVTNTNWQAYAGEVQLSYLSQMLGLGVQNFLSAASGMAVLIALIRALKSDHTDYIGNFWLDVSKAVIFVLLPLAIVLAIVLISQGVVQTLAASQHIDDQVIAVGPVASQVAIKILGSNGGGFFNVNAAHPLENPNAFTYWIQLGSIILLPIALCFTFGKLIKDIKQGIAILISMFLLLIPFILIATWAGSASLASVVQDPSISLMGANLEGKEMRIDAVPSALWGVLTTATSNGSTVAAHDSFAPLTLFCLMSLMGMGEVVLGGVGCGLYGMLSFVILTVFLTNLMIGHTPQYLGKKIEVVEVRMACIITLVPILTTLLGASLAVSVSAGTEAIFNPGARGFGEISYALLSTSNNNGSALGGLNSNSLFYNLLLGAAMLGGRFGTMLPVLVLAGALAKKKLALQVFNTIETTHPIFILSVSTFVLLVGALTLFPALALAPLAGYFTYVA